MENKIPKVIHYIWLGGKPLPKTIKKYLKTWQKHCPDYEFKRWDESNIDLNFCKYCKDAYDAKKYAFASDVVRFDILYKEGGIYLDIDVEILKPIDKFLDDKMFMGFENSKFVAPGLIMGCQKGTPLMKEMLDVYQKAEFDSTNPDKWITVCSMVTDKLKEYGLKQVNETQKLSCGTIYSSDYFCPKDMSDGRIVITENTHTIHHYLSSWGTPWSSFKRSVKQFIKRLIGKKNVEKLKNKLKKTKDGGSL